MSDLDRYPRPTLAVDLVLLTLLDHGRRPEVGVVVLNGAGSCRALPGRFVRERETIIETARHLVHDKLDLTPSRTMELTMLGVWDEPRRDSRGWVVSVSHRSTLSRRDAASLPHDRAAVVPLHGSARRGSRVTPEPLAFDHDSMVTTALRRVRREYERPVEPDPIGLIEPPYTLTQLRHVHEAVLDTELRRDTFNRWMTQFLDPATGRGGQELTDEETGGRPARMWQPKRHRQTTSKRTRLPRIDD